MPFTIRSLLLQLLLKSVQNPLPKNELSLKLVKQKFKLKVLKFNSLFDFSIVYYNFIIRIRHCYSLSLRPTYRGTCQMKTSSSSITHTHTNHSHFLTERCLDIILALNMQILLCKRKRNSIYGY